MLGFHPSYLSKLHHFIPIQIVLVVLTVYSCCTNRHCDGCFVDHVSNYSDDLDTDELATFLNSWEDASSDVGPLSPSKTYASEKFNSVLDVSVGMPSEPEPAPPPGPPPMDIEADFTVGEMIGIHP